MGNPKIRIPLVAPFPVMSGKGQMRDEVLLLVVVAGSLQPLHANGSKPGYAKNIHDQAQPR